MTLLHLLNDTPFSKPGLIQYYVINYLNKKGEHLVKYDWCFMQKTNHKTNKKFTQQTFHCLDNFT